MKKSFILILLLAVVYALPVSAQSDTEFLDALQKIRVADRQIDGLSPRQIQVRVAWETGKAIDEYSLEINRRASQVIEQAASSLKEDASKLYYALQFFRAYPDAPPALDLHWGFFQYLLAVNDPKERDLLAQRAVDEKWNWDKLREEIKLANRDNQEYVFTRTPGKPGTYRVMKAKYGPHRGKQVIDLGFSNDFLPSNEIKVADYEIVETKCRGGFLGRRAACQFKLVSEGEGEKNLFTYSADIIKVIDGDTFQAVVDLGFGVTTEQTFRLWGLDAPEMNERDGRAAKKALEKLTDSGPITLRAMRMDKYGRYLTDIWVSPANVSQPSLINETLIAQGFAKAQDRS